MCVKGYTHAEQLLVMMVCSAAGAQALVELFVLSRLLFASIYWKAAEAKKSLPKRDSKVDCVKTHGSFFLSSLAILYQIGVCLCLSLSPPPKRSKMGHVVLFFSLL